MWAIILSDRLAVIALVSLYLTNKLIAHEPLSNQKVSEEIPTIYSIPHVEDRDYPALATVSSGCSSVRGTLPMYYSPLRRSTKRISHPKNPSSSVRARLACLIHAASVHSEPGSNPSLLMVGQPKLTWVFLTFTRTQIICTTGSSLFSESNGPRSVQWPFSSS